MLFVTDAAQDGWRARLCYVILLQEVVALNAAIEAGVLVIAGVECSSFWSLSSRPQLAAWLQLGGRSGTTAVVELQGINR